MAQIYGELIRAQLQVANGDLSSPVVGLVYFNNDTVTPANKGLKVYDGSLWQKLVTEAALADLSALPIITLAKGGLGANASAWSGFVKISAGTASAAALSASDLPIVTAAKGGLGRDASAFTGVVKASSGTFSASALVDADVSATAAIAQSKIANLTTDLGNKVEKNSSITGATKTKITYDAKGLVTAGADLVSADIPATLLSKVVSSTAAMTGALTLPVGTTGERPAALQGMVRYNTTLSTFEGHNGSDWGAIGGAGAGGTTDQFTQASPVLAVGDVVYLNGSVYTKAVASAANTAEVVGVISKDPSTLGANKYEITLSGEVSGLTGLVAGEVYFLSAATAGALTVTEPTTVGHVSLPVGVASSATSLYVAPKRGVVVGGANARTQIPLGGSTSTSVTTTVQNVAAYEAGELSGWIAISATTPLKFYVNAQFSKNGAGNNYNISYQTSGDTPPVGFLLQVTAAGLIQAVLPSINGFNSASITYGLDVAAIGTSFPLSVDGSSITTGTLDAARIPSLSASKITLRTSGAPTSNVVAFASFSGTLPKTVTLPSTGSSYQIVNYSIFFRYNNVNGTPLTPRVQIEIRDGATSLYAVIFTNVVVTGFNDYMSFSGLAILPAPATSYSVIASDVQIDGGSHSITNSFLSCSSSLIVF